MKKIQGLQAPQGATSLTRRVPMSEIEEVQEQMKVDMEALKEQMTMMMEAIMSMRKMMEDNTATAVAASTATEMDSIHLADFNQVIVQS